MTDMQPQQQAAILRAIAASSLGHFSPLERQQAFQTLTELKSYPGRLPWAIQALLAREHVYQDNSNSQNITTTTKMLALEIMTDFLTRGYTTATEQERIQLRTAVLEAARMLALPNSNPNQTSAASSLTEARILGKKLALILEGLVVRDFPQRWTTFTTQVFKPLSEGGLWCDAQAFTDPSILQQQKTTVSICLECLKLIAEDCTDSDYNAKISTQRRNDVLIGLNEVKNDFLPRLFSILQQYPTLVQTKTTLHNMHQYILQNLNNPLAPEERAQYEAQLQMRESLGQLMSDTLVTLTRFGTSMPINWMWGGSPSSSNNNPTQELEHDFVAAFLHLLRERDSDIQIRAAECLEELAIRGKLEYAQWRRLLVELPAAVGEANQVAPAHLELEQALERVKNPSSSSDPPVDPWAAQLPFHKALTKMMAVVVSAHMTHIVNKKGVLDGKGQDFQILQSYLKMLVEILQHPSGRIASEQITLWSMVVRDPQVARSAVFQPHAAAVLACYMKQLVRIPWEQVEDETLPNYQIYNDSFDDEDDYSNWMADIRSRSNLIFKFIGSTAPATAAEVLKDRVLALLAAHGNGQPLNSLDPSNNQLTPKSEAIVQFEALYQPLDNVLSGIPSWTLDDSSKPPKEQQKVQEIRSRTRAALSTMVQSIIQWNPEYLWLRFRRAAILETLKYYWKQEPSTLLPAVSALIGYIGLNDEWVSSTAQTSIGADGDGMSAETVSLKKKSGVALVAIAKLAPHHLVPWLNELSNTTSNLLSSQGLIPLNQMHLYEFLTCVASAVEDSTTRAGFIATVLSGPLEVLQSNEVQQQIASPAALMSALGITQSTNASQATDADFVRSVYGDYVRMFTSLNRLLSVGKRCNEAARKRRVGGIGGVKAVNGTAPGHFLDEGPLSLQDLAINDPFAPLWPQVLPSLIKLTNAVLGIWRPENQAVLLRNSYQRYALAISDDEVFSIKNHDKSSGGVFGEGGTAGSIVNGTDRRDVNLVPKWSGWLSELRNTCFQMFGLLATGRALFSPELRENFPAIVSAMVDTENMKSMEHRHLTQYLKHVTELTLLSCPSSLYATHLGPIIAPVFEHIRFRLDQTWSPFLSNATEALAALTPEKAVQAADMAAKAGDAWYSWYYAHCGLFVGDLDKLTADSAVEKFRVDISRVFSDVLQASLALKGDWALVLATQARDDTAMKKNDASRLTVGPRNQTNSDNIPVNADGSPRTELQSATHERKLARINGIGHFMFLENEAIAGNLALVVIQCLAYPDQYTVRRITKIGHRMLEIVAFAPHYTELLGQRLFGQAVKNVVSEPKWMVGLEWETISLLRDIYCRLVLGQMLLPGGQGPGVQSPLASQNPIRFEQTKSVNDPLHGGGILETPSLFPRQILAGIPGIGEATVAELEARLNAKRAPKDQKDAIRDLLRLASDNVKDMLQANGVNGIFERAGEEESLLHVKSRQAVVPALPEKLVTKSQIEKRNRKEEEAPNMSLFKLF